MRQVAAVTLLVLLAVVAVPSPAAAAEPIAAHEAFTARVVELTNAERARAGLALLTVNPGLAGVAQGYAEVLAAGDCFAHTCGLVPDLAERAERAGYTGWVTLGENIAGGQRTPEQVVGEWMASPGHRGNILDASFTEIGVGAATGGPRGIYWAQAFGARRGATHEWAGATRRTAARPGPDTDRLVGDRGRCPAPQCSRGGMVPLLGIVGT